MKPCLGWNHPSYPKRSSAREHGFGFPEDTMTSLTNYRMNPREESCLLSGWKAFFLVGIYHNFCRYFETDKVDYPQLPGYCGIINPDIPCLRP